MKNNTKETIFKFLQLPCLDTLKPKYKLFSFLVSIVLVSFFLCSCANNPKSNTIAITALAFSPTCPITLALNSSIELTVTQTPNNATAGFNVSVDDPSKVSHDTPSEVSNGKSKFRITRGSTGGEATITAASGSVTAKCKIQ